MSDGMTDCIVHYEEAKTYNIGGRQVLIRKCWDGWGEWYECLSSFWCGWNSPTLDNLTASILEDIQRSQRISR